MVCLGKKLGMAYLFRQTNSKKGRNELERDWNHCQAAGGATGAPRISATNVSSKRSNENGLVSTGCRVADVRALVVTTSPVTNTVRAASPGRSRRRRSWNAG